MKAILKFDLTDAEDAERYRRHNKADDMAAVLYLLCNKDVVSQDVRKEVNSWCESYGIDFEEIYT